MPDEKKRDWVDILDIISKLLIPVVIAFGGILYSHHQTNADKQRIDAERENEDKRRNLERDTGYVKMLLSKDADEKALGVDIIRVMSRQNKFSPDLLAVLTIMAGDDKNGILAQAAGAILANQQQVNSAPAPNASPDVYIQISNSEQKSDAEALQEALRKDGFGAPRIELVTGEVATVHTYVRFFSAPGALQANRVKDAMSKLGYASPTVQDFSAFTQSPLSSVEVWIGKSQGKLPNRGGT
jgi:hypothetical protein